MTENSTIHAQNCRTDIGIGKQVTASVKGYVDGHLYMIDITVHPVEITFDFGEEKIMRGSYFSSKNQEMVWFNVDKTCRRYALSQYGPLQLRFHR